MEAPVSFIVSLLVHKINRLSKDFFGQPVFLVCSNVVRAYHSEAFFSCTAAAEILVSTLINIKILEADGELQLVGCTCVKSEALQGDVLGCLRRVEGKTVCCAAKHRRAVNRQLA